MKPANFKSLIFLLLTAFSGLSPKIYASGDTTMVRTFNYNSSARSGMFQFPDDTSKTYEKIIMLYSMRCKNGLVSTSSQRDLGCGEWDYNCYTYLIDSSLTDSLSRTTTNYIISNWSDSLYPFTVNPQWNYIRYSQQDVTYTSTLSETAAPVGSGAVSITHPIGTASSIGKVQYLWTAAELLAAGFIAGPITGIALDLSVAGNTLDNLRIKMAHTLLDSLTSASPVTTGLSEVYHLNTPFATTGLKRFNFYNSFVWDGTSNVVIEFSYSNAAALPSSSVNATTTTQPMGISTVLHDNYMETYGGQAVIDLPVNAGAAIADKITIAFWCYGNPAKLPANTSIFEALDAAGRRQLNLHLPWSNGSIYWDCGNDGTGYDRINKAATAGEIAGQWNFWTVTKDATTGSMKIYLNGNLWHSGTGLVRPISITRMKLARSISGGYLYYGSIDEFSMWNTELSQGEILDIMQHSIESTHPAYSNLQVYYKMDELSGNIVTDASPNGFDATVFNMSRMERRGKDLFRNFSNLQERPNTTFYTGNYITSVQTLPVYDSVAISSNAVIAYGVVNNSLVALDTNLYWAAGVYSYIFDETGIVVDSMLIAVDSTLQLVPLNYYEKRPAKIELINFITPYGINLDLDGLNGKTWAIDVTDYAPVLRGLKYMSMEAGKYQEDNDITFVFYEGTPPRTVKSMQSIWPNASWLEANYTQIVNNMYFEPRNIVLSPDAEQYKVRSAISGHGQEGEFIPRTHTIRLNNNINFSRSVWTECATNPIYPQGGTWVYDRAGWCPGAAVDVREFELTPYVIPGQTITLDHTLPAASNTGTSNYRINNQLVSYGPINFTLDAAVDYIKAPTNRIEFGRFNPVCNQPVVAIKNTGSTTLSSLDITYGRKNGSMSTYQWTGTLDFLQSTEVILPQPNWLSSNSNEFIVMISNPNGGTDQYGLNDTLVNTFQYTGVYASDIVVEVRTNNNGSHTTYTLRDGQGNILLNRSGLLANTVYRDTFNLPADCYTLQLNDAGDDGLSWWANTAQGTGYFRLKKASTGAVIKTFNPDFGDNVYQQFTINYTLPVEEIPEGEAGPLNIYPNPAGSLVTAEFSLSHGTSAKLLLMDLLGQQVMEQQVYSTEWMQKVHLDISQLLNGFYYVVLQSGNVRSVRKLSIQR